MEFFDSKKNWAIEHIKVGRSWKKDELRIKSNQDLHKLWYENNVYKHKLLNRIFQRSQNLKYIFF